MSHDIFFITPRGNNILQLSIINNRQFNSDALVNPLESIVKENRAFEGTRLFAEAELLRKNRLLD